MRQIETVDDLDSFYATDEKVEVALAKRELQKQQARQKRSQNSDGGARTAQKHEPEPDEDLNNFRLVPGAAPVRPPPQPQAAPSNNVANLVGIQGEDEESSEDDDDDWNAING